MSENSLYFSQNCIFFVGQPVKNLRLLCNPFRLILLFAFVWLQFNPAQLQGGFNSFTRSEKSTKLAKLLANSLH